MGQQQLILLVLATVIVGIAIVVGIRAFTENDARANADAMMQDAVRMANDVQAAIKKPAPFGGVNDFSTALTFGTIGYPNTSGVYTNLNGSFTIACTANDCTINGYAAEDALPTPPTSAAADQHVQLIVCGLTDANISAGIIKVGGSGTGITAAPTCT